MGADQWARVEDLYHQALRLAGAQRARFLDESCGDNLALRTEIESLLTYATSADAFMTTPAIDVAARLMARDVAAEVSLAGATIGPFQVLEKLGEGGMGVVYEAIDTRLGRKVALKLLRASAAARPEALEQLEREARAASALNHPNICTIHSVHIDERQPYIEMERLEGRTLRERLAAGPLGIDEAVSLTRQLVDGLEAAHRQGIVHRDLTPGNIFCTSRGAAKILDFGIAQLESAASAGAVIGTVGYMSPEQAAGQPVDSRTDLFSLGAVIYQMATGRAPFPGPSAATIRQAVLSDEPMAPRRLNPTIPASFERLILRALQKDPDRRYQRAADVRADLERLQRGAARRRLVTVAALAAGLVLAAGAAAFWYWSDRPDDMFATRLRVRQLTHNASELGVGTGAISPDGRYVAYTDPRGIHVLAVETGVSRKVPGSEPELVPPGAVWDVTAGWLPNGSAFVANLATESTATASSIWTVDPAGAPRRLREGARAAAVSTDGSWIGFSTDGDAAGDREIWVMHPDGSSQRRVFLADAGSRVLGLAWSRDASRVAYVRTDDQGTPVSIDTRDLRGGPASTIVRPPDPEILTGVAWLRDGRLLYSLRRAEMGTTGGSRPCSHWQLRVDNQGSVHGTAVPLAGWVPQCVTGLSVTSDGRQALYAQWAVQDVIHVLDLDAGGNRAGAGRRLTLAEGRNIPSGWAADGRTVVFVSDERGRPVLVRQGIDEDTAQPIVDEPGIVGAARVTPDGRFVIYLVQSGARAAIATLRSLPIAGGDAHDVVSGKFVDGGARCAVAPASLCAFAERSADGRQIVFTAIEPPQGRGRELARVDVEATGEYRWALSPDGTRLAILNVNVAHPRIRVVSFSRASEVTIDLVGVTASGYLSWTSDGQRLLVPDLGRRSARLLSVDPLGNARVIWEQPGAQDVAGIPSPDGRHVAIWVRGRSSNLWLAETPR